MNNGKRLLPQGWQIRILAVAGAALAGNFIMGALPWPGWMRSSYEAGAAAVQADPVRRLLTILLLAPVAEEGIFRLLIFGRLLSAGMGFPGAAVLSSLAFGSIMETGFRASTAS